MPWNPDQYNQFKKERYQPFFDLINHITPQPNLSILDLGCGTGELTKVVADNFPDSNVKGIDNSPEMLAQAPQQSNLSFGLRSIEEQLLENETWDLIIANASLQWIDDHQKLFPTIISKLNGGGQLAIQMPSQTENILNKMLLELVQEYPFHQALEGWTRPSPVLSLDDYTNILFKHGGKELVIYQKVYPIIAQSSEELYAFIAGSALVPYMERLSEIMKDELEKSLKRKIAETFDSSPAVYAFKRIILYARF
jgi:trans-aconitate 2-methyltransferase